MKIIVGLGNPGRKYERTPHNLGFETVDRLATLLGAGFRPWRAEQAEVAEARIGQEPCLLAKPTTWMNLSGGAVAELMRNRPVEMTDLLVITDDVNLPVGRLRVRSGGSAGGHKGLRSIIERLGGEGFARLRIGCAPGRSIESLADYVLSVPPPQDATRLREAVMEAAQAAEVWAQRGPAAAANKFNGPAEKA